MSLAIPFCEKHQEQKIHTRQRYRCRSCKREYKQNSGQNLKNQLKATQRRADWMLANGPCRHCGSSADLEVDHIDPSTKNPVLRYPSNAIWRWGDQKRNEELAKCQVLCRPCHLKKTINEMGGPAKHGTYGRYVRHKCRCIECTRAAREYANQRYWKNRDRERAILRVSYWKRKLRQSGAPETVQLPEDLLHLRCYSDLELSVSDAH